MENASLKVPRRALGLEVFVAIQVGVMLVAISSESLWIDEFWGAYYASSISSLSELYELVVHPTAAQNPLHFVYVYFWGLIFPTSEFGLRLANLPLFVLGQLSLFLALRTYPKRFAYLLLAVSSLYPMVWQYANEVRPYTMLYAGAQMVLAYILHIESIKGKANEISPLFSGIFVLGSILLFGATMVGVFWLFSACLYILYFHYQHLDWRYLIRGVTPFLVCIFIVPISLLTVYYVNSVLNGGGASRIASTTIPTLLFDVYELLGLSGIGPGRLELRDGKLTSLANYWIWLIPAAAVVLTILANGMREARKRLGARKLLFVCVIGLLPVAIIVASGFAMHWRVLGRHMLAEVPLLNLLFALGLSALFDKHAGAKRQYLRIALTASFFLVLIYSSCSLRFAERHKKDDYRSVASIARQEVLNGKRVWWAADALGANHYGVPGKFNHMNELLGLSDPLEPCIDHAEVRAIGNASSQCLRLLTPPDVVILSKPDVFDQRGTIAAYLRSRNYENVQTLPAFTVWHQRR